MSDRPVISVRCHPSRRAWYEHLLSDQGCELVFDEDESLCPGMVYVTPAAYAEYVTATIGFVNDPTR
jgi:hypothetical protein